MKNIKKLFGLLFAFVFALVQVNAAGNGSITINKAVVNETYSIYIAGDYTDDKDCRFKVTVDYWDEDIRRFMSPYYRTELGRFTKFTEKVGEPVFETSYRPRYLMTFDEIMAIKPYKVQTYLCNGKPYEILRDRQYRGVQLW